MTDQAKGDRAEKKRLPWENIIAWALTAVILGGAVSWAAVDWAEFASMDPNAWGDLLSGVFGSLAFVWLVAGYFLQRQELKLQRQELEESRRVYEQQAEELRHAWEVNEARLKHEQGEAARLRQADLERSLAHVAWKQSTGSAWPRPYTAVFINLSSVPAYGVELYAVNHDAGKRECFFRCAIVAPGGTFEVPMEPTAVAPDDWLELRVETRGGETWKTDWFRPGPGPTDWTLTRPKDARNPADAGQA